MPEKITAEVMLTKDDLYEFRKAFLLSQNTIAGIIIPFGVFVFVSFLYTTVRLLTKNNPLNALLYLIPAAAIAMALLVPRLLRAFSDKQFDNTPQLREKRHYEIDGEGITLSSESVNEEVMWIDLYQAREGKDAIYLYYSQVNAHILPKRCFSGGDEDIEKMLLLMETAPIPKEEARSFFKKLFFNGFGFIMLLALIAIILYIVWSI